MSKNSNTDDVPVNSNLAALLYAELTPSEGREVKREHARRSVRVALDVELNGVVHRAYTQNVGPDSMSLICKAEATTRTPIRVRRALEADECWCTGLVRHCTGTLGGFKIGLQFVDPDSLE